MLSKISKETNVSRHFQYISAEVQQTACSLLCVSPPCQLTMEELCRLKPLHFGLSPVVLGDLRWPEISETARCQCWRALLTELKPGHRAMLYNAVQEVTSAFFLLYITYRWSYLFIPPYSLLQLLCCCHMLCRCFGSWYNSTSPAFLLFQTVQQA